MAMLLLVQTPTSTYTVRQHLPSRDVVDPPLFTITGDVTVIRRDGFAAAAHLRPAIFTTWRARTRWLPRSCRRPTPTALPPGPSPRCGRPSPRSTAASPTGPG